MEKLLIENGTVYTMDPARPQAENVYAEDGVIRALNLTEEEKAGLTGAKRLDLAGGCLLPGFHDSHLHMIAYAMSRSDSVDLSGAGSIDEIKELLRAYIQRTGKKPGSWVVGTGWNHELFEEKRMPTREDLDEVSTEHYIFIKRVCIHIAAINSPLVGLSGIEGEEYREDGNIGRYPDGRVNGVIFEDAINDPVLIKKPPYTTEEIEALILETTEQLRGDGFTSIQTDDMKAFSDMESKKRILSTYDRLRNEGRLPLRIVEQLQVSSLAELEELMEFVKTIAFDDRFAVGPVKVLLDGTLGGRTAAMSHPYRDDPSALGVLNFSDDELCAIMDYCYGNDLQIACHTIGDRALEQMLGCVAKMKRKYKKDLRPRVVHCQIPTYEQIRRMAELGTLADIQPMFVPSDYELVTERIESEYLNAAYAWKTLLREGVSLAGSSDCPVESYLPFKGIRAAAVRTDSRGLPEGGFRPFEKLTVFEALSLYTTGAAYSVGREGRLGKIKEGFAADFVIVEQNPYLIQEEKLDQITVRQTICAGR